MCINLATLPKEDCNADSLMILDPFMGSGTTALAAIETGNDFMGCDMDMDYYNLTCERIRSRIAGTDRPYSKHTLQIQQNELNEV